MDKRFHKNIEPHTDYEEAFLEDVADQIAYKPLRPAVVRELKDHIDDRTKEYLSEGLGPEDAVRKAVNAMGDGVAVGTEINAVRHVRSSRLLILLTAVLLFIGLLAETCTAMIPELTFRGIRFYLAGTVLLVFVAWKGYPLLIRYQKRLLILAAAVFSVEAVLLQMIHFDLMPDTVWDTAYIIPWHMIDYYTILLSGPVIVILVYRMRKQVNKAMTAAFLLTAGAVLLHYFTYKGFTLAEMATFLFSMIGTLMYMICREIVTGNKRTLLLRAAAGSAVLLLVYGMLPGQSWYFDAFLNPESSARDTLSDSYNGVLIQELLSKSPLVGRLSLTPDEMMEYGTGEWYFNYGDAREAAAEGKKPFSGHHRPIFPYDKSEVTLWNILPQYYANNYLLAVSILQFGWLAGMLFLAVIALFYVVLFSCIARMRGALAGAVSFHCGLCLLFQSLLYILGNLGFQYGSFPNLPLVSEGSISILVNMLLLGFVFSAYRYDRVIEAPACGQTSGVVWRAGRP